MSKPKNRPKCPRCQKSMSRNGKVASSKRQRWICLNCKVNTTSRNNTREQRKLFCLFIKWITSSTKLSIIAELAKTSPRTLQRAFQPFWLIRVPNPEDGVV